jgi:integrase
MKLTKTTVARLKLTPGRDEEFFYDDDLPGFGLRVRATKSTWFISYRLGGRGSPQRRLTIGPLDNFGAEAARAAAKEMLAKVRLGADPQHEKATRRIESAQTVGAVAELYLKRAADRVKANSLKETTRYLRQHWAALASVPVAKLDRATVAAELAKIKDKSGGYAANRARGALSAMLSWAMREGLAPSNPAAQTNKPLEKETTRDRVLSRDELCAVWIEALSYGGDFGAIVRLLILTGARRDEVGGMLWNEIDLAGGVWTLGADRAKNSLRHEVPLSRPALTILQAIKDRQSEGDAPTHVFGRRGTGFSGWSKAKDVLDARVLARIKADEPDAKMPEWRVHDLRRTAATGMADIGVQPHIIEAVLNHISGHKGGVAGVYNRAAYGPERREALDKWAAHVVAVVGIADELDENKWREAVRLDNAQADLERPQSVALRRLTENKARTAGHKITPGAKAAALERNRPLKAAIRAELHAGETNMTRIAERATKKVRELEQAQASEFDQVRDKAKGRPNPALKARKASTLKDKTLRRLIKNQMV